MTNDIGEPPLFWAIGAGSTRGKQSRRSSTVASIAANPLRTTARSVSMSDVCKLIAWLLDGGASCDGVDGRGVTPLAAAMSCGNQAGARVLALKGATVPADDAANSGIVHSLAESRAAQDAHFKAMLEEVASEAAAGSKVCVCVAVCVCVCVCVWLCVAVCGCVCGCVCGYGCVGPLRLTAMHVTPEQSGGCCVAAVPSTSVAATVASNCKLHQRPRRRRLR